MSYINTQRGSLFSIRRWVNEGRGVLFLPYQAAQIAALHSVISTWIRIAICQTMGLPEPAVRPCFVVDELDSLGPIDGLKDALPRLRKFIAALQIGRIFLNCYLYSALIEANNLLVPAATPLSTIGSALGASAMGYVIEHGGLRGTLALSIGAMVLTALLTIPFIESAEQPA